MNKKGAELSLNVIIIAAIGLLILVILAFLVVRNVAQVPQTQKTSCALNGGLCRSTPCDPGAQMIPPAGALWDCKDATPNCCKAIG